MQFQVPQFIEVEDKIFGPLTLKEFIYLAVAGGVVFMLFFILQTWLWVIMAAILVTGATAFAFIKINGRPLAIILIAALRYAWQPKFYLWRREATKPQMPTLRVPKTENQPLKHLWLKINTSTEAVEGREKGFNAFSFFKKSSELTERFEAVKKETGDREVARRIDYR